MMYCGRLVSIRGVGDGDDAGRAYPGMDQAGEVAETAERDVNEGIGGAYAAFDPYCANCQLLRQEVGIAG
jgi:hypothetical protein